ncbi:MAG: hypothetical protein ACI857_002534, partial [Arenicella sp.]
FDYFKSDKKDTTSSDFRIGVQEISLNDIHFSYEDQNAKEVEHGMNFANIDLKHLHGTFSDFRMEKGALDINMEGLRFEDKSGFRLMHLTSQVHYDSTLLALKNMKLGFYKSYLQASYFELHTPNGPSDWKDFVNNVRFKAQLNHSRLYVEELAYFVPSLWGMTDHIDIHNIEVSKAINGMKLKNVNVSMLDTTRIKGDFEIPDLANFDEAFFQEDISLFQTSISDVRKMDIGRILNEKSKKKLEQNLRQFQSANIIKLENGSFAGYLGEFVVDGDLYTGIGNVHSDYGLKFTYNNEDSLYHYEGGAEGVVGDDVIVENLNLGTITGNDLLGAVTGHLTVKGKGFDEKELDVSFNGFLGSAEIYGYDYHGIKIEDGEFGNNLFKGVVSVEDDNLALVYDGSVDLKNDMFFDFQVRIDSALWPELNNSQKDLYQRFASHIDVNVHGTDLNSLYGDVTIKDLDFKDRYNYVDEETQKEVERQIDFEMDELTLHISRSEEVDSIKLRSPYIDMDLAGKYDIEDVGHAITEQLAYVLGNVIEDQHEHDADHENFSLNINLKDANSLLQFYDQDIYVESGSSIRSEFDHTEKRFGFDFNSSLIEYHGMIFEEVNIENHFDSVKANIFYQADFIQITDSLAVRHAYFDSRIKENHFTTMTGWDGTGRMRPALFAFESLITKDYNILTSFSPSFFYLKDHKYDVSSQSKFLWNPEHMVFKEFEISHKGHSVGIDGTISENPDDWLRVKVTDFDLADLDGLVGEDLKMRGLLNIDGGVADVYDQIKFEAETKIKSFEINESLVGDIYVDSDWNKETKSIELKGNLSRDSIATFSFYGDYHTALKKDNIDLTILFDQTDISFLNAFEDPELYTDIGGILDGELEISGELNDPIVDGDLNVLTAKVKVPMFNVFFGATGRISFADGEIIADHLAVIDQESNIADAQLSIYHYNWGDWNYNVMLDMANPSMTKEFLVMDTHYKEGDYYYGKAYVTGYVDIFGYDGQTEIDVDLETKDGTALTLPMFGNADIEENSFVIFDDEFFLHDSLKTKETQSEQQGAQRLGMTLNMKFKISPSAEVKIVFDPLTGDQIIAKGDANIEMLMDDFGNLTMTGKYVVNNGLYEMRIKKLVEEDFELVKGGTVEWTGSPYDADINLQAQFLRNVTLADIMPPGAGNSKNKDDVYGILQMSNTLMKPELGFAISSPKANDLGKQALAELSANTDELNKQFFSLLVLKRFIPLYGGGAGGENVVLGLAETQINSILSGLSENYDLLAGLSDGQTTVGFETQLNDRTTITTSFGVLSPEDGETVSGGNIVGDVDIEYRLNDDGTFTMNFFNETNDASVTAQGHFTQGVSLHYQETFNTAKEFKLLQKFLNIFRKKDKKVKFEKENRRSEKWQPLPEEDDDTQD